MSNLNILAKSPYIIYRPGGTPGGLVVTTWAQIQKFIAARQGAVIVYVDDSITTPALVPGATGVTPCFGRVEFRPYAVDGTTFAVLQVEDGATLQDLYAVRGMELRCNCRSATPSLTYTIAPTGGDLNLFDFANLSNAATATQPALVIAAGKQFFLLATTSFFTLNAPAVPLIAIAATGVFNLEVFDGTGIPNGLVSGPVGASFSLVYDNSSASLFPTPGALPTQPAFTGTFLSRNLDDIWVNKVLDPVTMGAPAVGNVPVFNADGTWHAGTAPASPSAVGTIIYRPGGPVTGSFVATWAAVRAFLVAQAGTPSLVLIDNSFVSPATDPSVAGVTNFENAMLSSNPAEGVATGGVSFLLPAGTVFQNLTEVTGYLFIQSNSDAPVVTDTNVNIYLYQGSLIQNTGSAPVFAVPAGGVLQMWLDEGSYIQNAGVSVIDVAAGATSVGIILADYSFIDDNSLSGAGAINVVISSPSASFDPFQQPAATALTFSDYTNNNVIYQPGGTSNGPVVATWEEVKAFITLKSGACIVYVDDSITSPALVPATAGVTECFGRLELRPFKVDSINFSVLQIEDGATLSNLYQVTDLELRLNCQSATKSLTWTGTPNGGFLILWQFGYLSMATTATQPGIAVIAGQTVLIQADNNGIIYGQGFTPFTVPLATVAATGEFQIEANNNSEISANFAEGAGDALLEYDDSSSAFFAVEGVPPALPSLTGTYELIRNSTAPQLLSVAFAFNTASPLLLVPVFAGGIMARAQIQITTAFNDPAATLLLGTSASPSLVMGAADSDPSVVDSYDQSTMLTFPGPGADKLQLTISPGASTQGAGILYYELRVQ